MPMLIMTLEDGTEKGKSEAKAELKRMAVNMDALMKEQARSRELLKASFDLLQKCDEAQATEVDYDGTTCDGACLAEDINNHLESMLK